MLTKKDNSKILCPKCGTEINIADLIHEVAETSMNAKIDSYDKEIRKLKA